jgi:hypothetical protein
MYFFYDKWDLQIIVDSKVGDISRCFSYLEQEFGLKSLNYGQSINMNNFQWFCRRIQFIF